jgi:hypothetical protein
MKKKMANLRLRENLWKGLTKEKKFITKHHKKGEIVFEGLSVRACFEYKVSNDKGGRVYA